MDETTDTKEPAGTPHLTIDEPIGRAGFPWIDNRRRPDEPPPDPFPYRRRRQELHLIGDAPVTKYPVIIAGNVEGSSERVTEVTRLIKLSTEFGTSDGQTAAAIELLRRSDRRGGPEPPHDLRPPASTAPRPVGPRSAERPDRVENDAR